MVAIVAAVLFGASLLYMKRTAGLYAFAAMSFLLFGFVLRMASAIYVGAFGPVYSMNFSRYLSDEGFASVVFAISLIIVVVVAARLIRPASVLKDVRPLAPIRVDYLAQAAIAGFIAYTVILYGDMLIRGVIPLFSLMERNDYTDNHAGIFHKAILKFNFAFSFLMGFFTVRPRMRGGAYDLRYLGVLMALFVYFFLTGHRFSIFFAITAFYLIPIAAVWVQGRSNLLPASSDPEQLRRVVRLVRAATPAVAIMLTLLIGWALYNSLYNVRSYSDPVQAFIQRSLVQPTEFWWAAWSGSILTGQFSPSAAFDFMFFNPIDPSRNTGIQYLMVQEMGFERAATLLGYGEALAGGYPEVMFELLGPIWAWPVLVIFALITINFLRIAMSAVCNQRLGTAFFAIFLFYGFSIFYIGGMLNFLLAPTLLLKFAGLLVFNQIEKKGILLKVRP